MAEPEGIKESRKAAEMVLRLKISRKIRPESNRAHENNLCPKNALNASTALASAQAAMNMKILATNSNMPVRPG
jgi:hypothetical protein